MKLLSKFFLVVSPLTALALGLLMLAYLVGRWFGLRIDDLHLLLFLPVVLLFWRLPRKAEHRVPGALLAVSVVLWLGSAAYVEGWIPGTTLSAGASVARLENDANGMAARELQRRFNEIARTYELPEAELTAKSFAERSEALAWLQDKESGSFVVTGNADWLQVVFSADQRRYLAQMFPALLEDRSDEKALERYGLRNGENIVLVQLPDASVKLAVTYLPEALPVPAEPGELTRHWLAWLNQALIGAPVRSKAEPQISAARYLAIRKDALLEAAKITGPWKSATPLGLTDYLLATIRLLDNLASGGSPEIIKRDVLPLYRAAAGKVDPKASPETYAAIFNNAAIAQLIAAEEPKNGLQARRWLERAAKSKRGLGGGIGLRAALYNLSALEPLSPR